MTNSSTMTDVFADLPLREQAGKTGAHRDNGIDLGLVERWLKTDDLPPTVQLMKLEEFSAILREEARDDVFGELEELIASLEMKIYTLRHAPKSRTREAEPVRDVFAAAAE